MDQTPWNLGELREHVRTLPDESQIALSYISSMGWADQIFTYHFCEARDALRAIPVDKDPNSITNHELLFAPTPENDRNKLIVRANVIACIYTIRNAYDHFAQLCNALLLLPAIPVDECNFYKVKNRLPQSILKEELEQLSQSEWFKYIAAYSNTSKHRALVQQSMHISFVNGTAGIRADGFVHDQAHEPRLISDLLEGVLEVKNQIIVCGRALNAQVLGTNG